MIRTDYREIVYAIQRRVASLPDAGHVHPTRFYSTNTKELRAAFFDETQQRLCGWTITRENIADEEVATNSENERSYRFVLRGFLGLQNDSETDILFHQRADAICDDFWQQRDLGGLCEVTKPVQGRLFDLIWFAESFCHYCELVLEVKEYITP